MRSIQWACLTAASLMICSSAMAGEQAKAKTDVKQSKTATKQEKVTSGVTEQGTLTGSHIKQTVRRHGQITDGSSVVIVLDNETIRKSGASDVRQLLVRKGVFH